jgi:glucosyl-dolichyl phosphate glucuronosyltransferase
LSKAQPEFERDISVIICTRNRAAQLGAVLTSMVEMVKPAGIDWEICIVDNGSTDHTAEVVESFAGRLPIRRVREDLAGLSNARNRGVAEAAGRYLCWTDDDVLVDPQWLAAYAAAFEQFPTAAIFGGRILPSLEPPTPAWFAENAGEWPLTSLLAARDLGDETTPLSFEGDKVPWGANFAVRAEEQRRCLYDPRLGVSPNQKRLGEETEVMYRLFQQGAEGRWVPGAKVHHIIPQRRQSYDYVHEYFFAMGETLAYLESVSPGDNHMRPDPATPSPVAGSDWLLHRRRAMAWLRYAAARSSGSPLGVVRALRQIGLFGGALAFRRAQAVSGRA